MEAADREGVSCPFAGSRVRFTVSGAGARWDEAGAAQVKNPGPCIAGGSVVLPVQNDFPEVEHFLRASVQPLRFPQDFGVL